MRIERSILPLFCAVAPVAAQLGLSQGLHSFTQELHSIFDPSDPPARLPQPTHIAHTPPQNTPEPQSPTPEPQSPVRQTQPPSQAPSPTPIAPPIRQSSVSPTTHSSQSHPVVTSSSTLPATPTNQHEQQQPVVSSTPTASSSSSGGGLSEGAKLGIGLTIGLLALCGLIGAGIYSFVKDRRASQAWADWRERRRAKHRRLNSATGSISSFRGLEKEKDIINPGYGNGTLLNQPQTQTTESAQNLVDEVPEPVPAVEYQQARMVHIKRKAVPGLPVQADTPTFPPSQAPLQEPPRSYVPYSSWQARQQAQHPMQQRLPAALQVRNQPPPHSRPPGPYHRTPGPPQIRHQPPPHARMQRPRYSWNQPPIEERAPGPLQVRNPSPLPETEAPRFSWVEDRH